MTAAASTGVGGDRATAASVVRVAVVDDSAVIRGIVTRWLEEDPDIKVVATFPNGVQAVRQIPDLSIDVVILDIEMPEMDGIEALPLLLRAVPDLKIIMSSTLTRRNAEISLKALSLGAVDYIAKPETRAVNTETFKIELIQKVRTHAAARHRRTGRAPAAPAAPSPAGRSAPGATPAAAPRAPSTSLWGNKAVVLRPASRARPTILAIGSSTGGPQALFKVLGALSKDLTVPVVVTQHMPATFTAILAEHIQSAANRPAKEAATGDILEAGHIYVAPGDFHMTVAQDGPNRVIRLNQDPPENFCRPAVDPMFRSVAKIYGSAALGVVLTGMGSDGREGGRVLTEAGGTIIAQDEASSVVWGMPGAVATAGIASQVLPLDQIAGQIIKYLKGLP